MDKQDFVVFGKRVTDIASRYFIPAPNTEAAKDPTYVKYCADACDVILSTATFFGALKTFHPMMVMSSFADMTMGMSHNTFWKQHSGYLSPIMNSAMNSMLDNYQLRADKQNNPSMSLWDNMEYATRTEWLSVPAAVAYCHGGYRKMREVSLALRKELETVL
jgi:hypothetical protein